MGQPHGSVVLLYACAALLLTAPTRGQNSTSTSSPGTTDQSQATSQTTTTQLITPTASSATTARVGEKSEEFGQCSCDLTSGVCDVNCCCDTACNHGDRLVFSTCADLPSLPASRKCVSDDLIVTTNLDYKTVTEHSNNLFCIYTDNNPSRNYYTTPDLVKSEVAFDTLVSRYGPIAYGAVSQSTTLGKGTAFYKESDPIVVVYPPDVRGWLGLPQPLADQRCDDSNPAGFLQARQTSCQRHLTDLSSTCSQISALAASTYYSQFQVAMVPVLQQPVSSSTLPPEYDENSTSPTAQTSTPNLGSTASASLSGNQLVNVTVGRVLCQNEAGVTTDCTLDVTPEPFYNQSASLCENAVLSVSYRVTHNATEGITAVTIHLTLVSIPSVRTLHTQHFAISFAKDGTAEGIPRSGNPGYIVGLPVLAGRLVNTGQLSYIELSRRQNQWLTVPQSPVGHISSSPDCITNPLQQTTVNFGQDMRSGCLLRVSRRNISQACTVLQSVSHAVLSPSTSTHVGIYGNVLPKNTADWVQVLQNVATPTESPKTDSCPSVRVGLHLEVLYANTGPLANPQAKIADYKNRLSIVVLNKPEEGPSFQVKMLCSSDVLALLVLGGKLMSRRLLFRHGVLWSAVLSNETVSNLAAVQCVGQQCLAAGDSLTQTVELTSSVDFVDVSTAPEAKLKRIPSARADLPYDFFYPFLQGGSRRNAPSFLVICSFLSLSLLLSFWPRVPIR